jgi:hypothetical protein
VLALLVQALALRPRLFQSGIQRVDGFGPLPEHQFERGGISLFVRELVP